MKYKYITIEGIIGAGKTTLAKKLATHFNAQLILEEFTENPFLSDFFKSGENALALELSFLNDRNNQLSKIFSSNREIHSSFVSDYYYQKSILFAQQNLNLNEFTLYSEIFSKIMNTIQEPDLLLFLDCPIEKALIQIQKRGRQFEKNIQKNYLEKIKDKYFQYLQNQKSLKVVLINTEKINFIRNPKDFGIILEILEHDFKPGLNKVSN